MELMDLIFGNNGGQQIGRIFKNYFSLTLLLQQLMLSLFGIPAYHPGVEPFPSENKNFVEFFEGAESPGEELSWIQALQLMVTLAQHETQKPLTSK